MAEKMKKLPGDKLADSTAEFRYAFYMGGVNSGKVVTERTDMQILQKIKKSQFR